MDDKGMRWAAGVLVVLGALASGCAHRSASIRDGTTLALACDRARSEAEANAVREAGTRQAGAMDYIAARASYYVGVAKEWSVGGIRPPGSGFVRRFEGNRGFTVRESRAAEECWQAWKREREAQLESQQTILTPPRYHGTLRGHPRIPPK
jgi:hypothetical protein